MSQEHSFTVMYGTSYIISEHALNYLIRLM